MTFYKETEFRETTIGKIPKEWDVKETEELGEVVTGITPSTFVKEYWNGDYPFVTPTDMTNGKYVEKTERKVTAKGLEKGRLIPKDSVLVTCIASIGKMALAFEDCLTNQQINAIICKEGVNPHYVYYALGFRTPTLKSWAGQTTNPIIKKSLFEKFPISLPRNEPEQQNIAEVLSTVDLAIQKTDNVIWKTERLKKGLMQTLLTKGIGHTEYKDTPIGKIPSEWQVLALQGICQVTDGSHWSPKEVEKSNYKIATVANLKETHIDIDSCKSISEEDYKRLVKEGDVPEKGDILFSKDGTVGISFAFKQHGNNIGLLSSIAIIRPDQTVLFPEFGSYAIKSPNVFWQVIGWKTGTALRRITLEHLKTIKIPIPSFSEQQKIAEILSTVDKKLELEKKEKARLERIKRGLMDLLLTGRIRVKVD